MSEHTMKVRIKQASRPNYWYADKIEEVFEVYQEKVKIFGNLKYTVKGELSLIDQDDCEVIEPRPFKVGDPVIHFQLGYGVVKDIAAKGKFTIIVVFADDTRGSFTGDGRYLSGDRFTTLFHADQYPEHYPQHTNPRPDLPVDQLLRVWGTYKENFAYRRFAKWSDDGQVMAWPNGADSKTNDGIEPVVYIHYEVVEE